LLAKSSLLLLSWSSVSVLAFLVTAYEIIAAAVLRSAVSARLASCVRMREEGLVCLR